MPSTDTFPAHLAPGLQARRLDLDADRQAVLDLVRAYDASHVQRPAQTPADVVADLASSGADLARNAWLVTDGDQAIGLGWFAVEDASPTRPVFWFDVYARPQLPVSAGLESTLVEAMLHRAGQELAASGAPEAVVESGCMRGDLRTDAALCAAGFSRERTFWRMERPLDRTQDMPAPPPGVVVRSARDEPADRSLLHQLFDATFAEHWGTVSRSDDEWWQRLRGGGGLDPAQWWVAELDGEPVGFLMGDAGRAPDGGGYVRYVGVLPRARGRGVGGHLLQVAFAEQARRGWTWSQLTVDTANVTGAPALYASVGMSPVEVIDLYRRTLARP